FVPQVDPDLAHAGAPGSNQHAFEKTMRVALEIPAILEGAGLAFVDVDRHDARLGLGGDEAPFATGRESGAAEAAQARILHDLGEVFPLVLTGEAVGDQLVAAVLAVLGIVDVRIDAAGVLLLLDRRAHLLRRGIPHRVLSHDDAGGHLAAAHARRWN